MKKMVFFLFCQPPVASREREEKGRRPATTPLRRRPLPCEGYERREKGDRRIGTDMWGPLATSVQTGHNTSRLKVDMVLQVGT